MITITSFRKVVKQSLVMFLFGASMLSAVQASAATTATASSNDGNVPANVLDGNIATRWSANGKGQWLQLDLGGTYSVSAVQLAFFKATERYSFFDLATSTNGSTWTTVLSGQSNTKTTLYNENYTFGSVNARYVRYVGQGNEFSTWNSITKMSVTKTSGTTTATPTPTVTATPTTSTGLNASYAPAKNFDLKDWYLSVPTNNGSGVATSIYEAALNNNYQLSNYFYTGSDGGMVFKCPINGYKTSSGTSYTRTELREMLRKGNTSISTTGVNKNNWVFGTASSSSKSAAGGYDGTLSATLAVNHVTTTGDSGQVGRVIVGQIHATDDEPLRIYYRKLPNNAKGSIYFAHEKEGGGDTYYELIGLRSDSASNPSDGVALNEKFSYDVKVSGLSLTVTIKRSGKADVSKTITMDSGYNGSDQYMYFKAGVYNQNNSGTGTDYVQATFYSLTNTHTGYSQ